MTDRPDLRAQRAYRARRTAKIESLVAGHRAILARLEGNDKSLAAELRAISSQALGEHRNQFRVVEGDAGASSIQGGHHGR